MSAPAQYPVGTIFEMLAIPAEARPRFFAELPAILTTLEEMFEVQAALSEISGGEISLVPQTPFWVDDEKGEKTIRVTIAEGESYSLTTKIGGDA